MAGEEFAFGPPSCQINLPLDLLLSQTGFAVSGVLICFTVNFVTHFIALEARAMATTRTTKATARAEEREGTSTALHR